MSERHVVVGAGPVGRAVARELVRRGAGDVVLVSRSGAGEEVEGARRVALDLGGAGSAVGLTALCAGAEVVYNAANPPSYDVWGTWWPPVAQALSAAAEHSGAVLATASCLYPYAVDGTPMVEGRPDDASGAKGRLRAAMTADAMAAHRAGRVRAVEVRGSDYLGPGVSQAHVPVVVPRALRGRAVRVFGDPDALHSFTDVRDMATALVTAAATPAAHGRVWHAPTNPPVSQAEAVAGVCRAAGVAPVRVRSWPRAMLTLGGTVVPFLREMRETVGQFEQPYVLDSAASEAALSLSPTPWAEVLRATAEQGGAVRQPVH